MMDNDSDFFVTPIHRMLQAQDENGKTLTMDELTANVLLILFGAEDTTSAILAAVMKRLHDSEEIFDKLKHEVRESLQEEFSLKELFSLPYLNGFFKEVMRMDFPVLGSFSGNNP
eukprot:UN17376